MTAKNSTVRISRLILIIFFALLPNSGCELIEIIAINCNECYYNAPEVGYIKAKITINEENDQVTITAFFGAYENNNFAFEETSTSEEKKLWLDTDKHYTLRAEYTKNGRTYYVINGAKLITRRDTESCDEPCYYITGKDVDLRLKF